MDDLSGFLLLLLLLLFLVLLALFSFLLLLVLSSVSLGVCHLFRIVLILNAMDLILVIGLARRVEPRGGKLLMCCLGLGRSLYRLYRVRLDSLDMLC